jgi:hypothetical protein
MRRYNNTLLKDCLDLYEEGALLRDCVGDLWMIAGYCKNLAFPTALPNAYDIVRLKDGNRRNPVFRMVHQDFDLVAEA